MGKELKIGSFSWAKFEDWIEGVLGKRSDWTTVAEIRDYSGCSEASFSEERSILSYLIINDEGKIKRAFEYDGWDTQYDQGGVRLEEADHGCILHESLGGVDARVFITHRESIGDYQGQWKMWPTFENYFDLRSDADGNLNDPYSNEMVAEVPFPSTKGPVRIRTDYLQDYLAARGMLLIRQHDHIRRWAHPIDELPESIDNLNKLMAWGCYRLDVANPKSLKEDRYSRLVAKDIVTPYGKAGTVSRKHGRNLIMEDYPLFITSKGIDGQELKQKPNSADILYPTYFSPKVLKRYYEEPSLYTVGFYAPGMGGVSFLDSWSFSIGRNSEGMIIAWLGDLAKQKLPYEEVNHWRVHNVPPRGKMAMDFWNAQMMCDPPKEPSLESRLKDCKYHLSNKFRELGFEIWTSYSGPDKHTEQLLREPLYSEYTEFRETLLLLSRMFCEYLNMSLLEKILPQDLTKGSDGKKLGSIVLFSNWLGQVSDVKASTSSNLKRALQNIQMLRSKAGVAHRFSDSSYKEAVAKLGLSGRITARELFSAVAVPLAESLETLCIELGIGDKLWWLKYR